MASLEKEKVSRGISRREFLITGALGGAGFLASKWGLERTKSNFSPFDLEKFKDFTVFPPEFPTPSELVGINLNAPFLWQEVKSPEKIEKAIENAHQFGARTVRVFVNDEFEPELGKYRFEVLEKIEKLAQKFPLQVDLFDAFPLLQANKFNVIYGSSSLSSPYLTFRKEKPFIQQQVNFFTDKSIREIFLKRVKEIVNRLHHTSGIVAWSVANELALPAGTKEEARKILTDWYEEVVIAIRQTDKERPILSGVADPNLLDEERLKACGLSVNTIHLYPFSGSSENILNAQQQRLLPLICQEIGFPSRIFGLSFSFAHDELFFRYLSHNFSSFFEVNERKKWLKPKITSIGLWRLTFKGDLHQDGFEIIPENLPKTLKILRDWEAMIKKATTTNFG